MQSHCLGMPPSCIVVMSCIVVSCVVVMLSGIVCCCHVSSSKNLKTLLKILVNNIISNELKKRTYQWQTMQSYCLPLWPYCQKSQSINSTALYLHYPKVLSSWQPGKLQASPCCLLNKDTGMDGSSGNVECEGMSSDGDEYEGMGIDMMLMSVRRAWSLTMSIWMVWVLAMQSARRWTSALLKARASTMKLIH